jgi:hypothetical protein
MSKIKALPERATLIDAAIRPRNWTLGSYAPGCDCWHHSPGGTRCNQPSDPSGSCGHGGGEPPWGTRWLAAYYTRLRRDRWIGADRIGTPAGGGVTPSARGLLRSYAIESGKVNNRPEPSVIRLFMACAGGI